MSLIEPRALRDAFGTFMTGVTVVTTIDNNDGGRPVGFTANSFTSVSLDPPLVLVCLAINSSNFDAFACAQGFAVNVLSEMQTTVSNTFASPSEDRFSDITWQKGPNGAPVLEGVCSWFDCSMHQTIDAGDHIILIGKVEAFNATPTAGLGYARGAYFTPSAQSEVISTRPDLVVNALIERANELLLVKNETGGLELPSVSVGYDGTVAAIAALLEGFDILAEPGFVYSIYDDTDTACQYLVFLCQADTAAPSREAFYALSDDILNEVSDPAQRSVLERFYSEKKYGNFGIYMGDKKDGKVKSLIIEG